MTTQQGNPDQSQTGNKSPEQGGGQSGGSPTNLPDETRDKHGNQGIPGQRPDNIPGTQDVGPGNPSTGGQPGAPQPRGDEPLNR